MFRPFQPILLLDAALLFRTLQVLLEVVDLNAKDNVRIHLHKASVAVKGKATVTGLLGQSLHCRAVESQIQDCIHHSCHLLQARHVQLWFHLFPSNEPIQYCRMKSREREEKHEESRRIHFQVRFLCNFIQLDILSTKENLLPRCSFNQCPGMDARAPERTDTSSGFVESPNLRPVRLSTKFNAFSTWTRMNFECFKHTESNLFKHTFK